MSRKPRITPSAEEDSNLYLRLVRRFPLRPIQSDEDLARAVEMLDNLTNLDVLSPGEQDYLEVLSHLVATYESALDPTPEISGGVLLHHLIEAKEVTQAEVAQETGVNESTISEIIRGKRGFSRKALLALADYFRVDPALFLRAAR